MRSQLSGGATAGIVVLVLVVIGAAAWYVFKPNAAAVNLSSRPTGTPQQQYEQMRKMYPNMPRNAPMPHAPGGASNASGTPNTP